MITSEIINYYIHFITYALLGVFLYPAVLFNFLPTPKNKRFFLYAYSFLKFIIINSCNLFITIFWYDTICRILFAPLFFVMSIIFFTIYGMWAANVSALSAFMAMVLTEIYCLITITLPCFVLNGLLDPAWSQSMNTPFNLINGLVLIICAILGFRINKLLAKRLNKFTSIHWKHPKFWYTLCIIYCAVGITGSATFDATNLVWCITYQIILIASGIFILYNASLMLKRRAQRKLYLENKYLLAENILLKEYYNSIHSEVTRAIVLCNELQSIRDELQNLTLDAEEKSTLNNYVNELKDMLDKEIAEGRLLLSENIQ